MMDMRIAVAERIALERIKAERLRQIAFEGHTPSHDDELTEGQLAILAAAYAMSSRGIGNIALVELRDMLEAYGWEFKPDKPDRIADLTRAGALILAELERRLRAQEKEDRRRDYDHGPWGDATTPGFFKTKEKP